MAKSLTKQVSYQVRRVLSPDNLKDSEWFAVPPSGDLYGTLEDAALAAMEDVSDRDEEVQSVKSKHLVMAKITIEYYPFQPETN